MVATSPNGAGERPGQLGRLIDLDVLPRPEPHMVLARGHRLGLGGTSVADFHRPFIEAADVLMVSADRLPDPPGFLTGAVKSGAALAVCTDGARGATALSATEGASAVDAITVPAVLDTNGAGDAFFVGLLAARADGRPLPDCLRWAAAAGALAVQPRDLVAPNMSRAAVQALVSERQ